MKVSVEIIGDGTVKGAGLYSMGDEVTLNAISSAGVDFSYFLVGEEKITDNPYIFDALDDNDLSLKAVFIVTLEGYLKASVGFEIPDAALMKIRVDRNLTFGQEVSLLSTKIKQLSYADCLMWAVNYPSTIQGAKDSDNGWSHQGSSGTLSITDKRLMRQQATIIYKRWGEYLEPTVKLITLNGSKADASARY
jgi:hypothetical protein